MPSPSTNHRGRGHPIECIGDVAEFVIRLFLLPMCHHWRSRLSEALPVLEERPVAAGYPCDERIPMLRLP